MTREKVITALDCCVHDSCSDCPYREDDNCSDNLITDAHYFIKKNKDETDLQSELKALKSEFQLVTDKHTKAEFEKEQLQMKIAELEKEMQYLKGKVEAYEFCWGDDK